MRGSESSYLMAVVSLLIIDRLLLDCLIHRLCIMRIIEGRSLASLDSFEFQPLLAAGSKVHIIIDVITPLRYTAGSDQATFFASF